MCPMRLNGFRGVASAASLVVENLRRNDLVIGEAVIAKLSSIWVAGVVKAGVSDINSSINDSDLDSLTGIGRSSAQSPGFDRLDQTEIWIIRIWIIKQFILRMRDLGRARNCVKGHTVELNGNGV